MTDKDSDDLELELQPESTEETAAEAVDELADLDLVEDAPADELADLEPEVPAVAEAPSVEAAPAAQPAADPAAGGQWVWQYAAPPPPPSFGAAFFSGTAVTDLYRRFAASLLVVIGCLLPWGPVMETVPNDPAAIADGGSATIEQLAPVTHVAGVETLLGALSLLLGLWLMYASCHGIYTSRQKILPVFLMIEPAIVTWALTLDAWGQLESVGFLDKLTELSQVAGTGVLMTLVGSTYVAGAFLFLFAKVFVKKDPEDKSAKRAAARSKKTDSGDKADAAGADDSADAKADKKGGRKRRR